MVSRLTNPNSSLWDNIDEIYHIADNISQDKAIGIIDDEERDSGNFYSDLIVGDVIEKRYPTIFCSPKQVDANAEHNFQGSVSSPEEIALIMGLATAISMGKQLQVNQELLQQMLDFEDDRSFRVLFSEANDEAMPLREFGKVNQGLNRKAIFLSKILEFYSTSPQDIGRDKLIQIQNNAPQYIGIHDHILSNFRPLGEKLFTSTNAFSLIYDHVANPHSTLMISSIHIVEAQVQSLNLFKIQGYKDSDIEVIISGKPGYNNVSVADRKEAVQNMLGNIQKKGGASISASLIADKLMNDDSATI